MLCAVLSQWFVIYVYKNKKNFNLSAIYPKHLLIHEYIRNFVKMKKQMKKAKSIEQQIELLASRGVLISDKEKAKEVLLDIGYYRLGFYFFPFEKSYPQPLRRTHEVMEGSRFEDAVSLYYFDFDLRNILNRYLARVEVAFRTYLTYYMSLKYQND